MNIYKNIFYGIEFANPKMGHYISFDKDLMSKLRNEVDNFLEANKIHKLFDNCHLLEFLLYDGTYLPCINENNNQKRCDLPNGTTAMVACGIKGEIGKIYYDNEDITNIILNKHKIFIKKMEIFFLEGKLKNVGSLITMIKESY